MVVVKDLTVGHLSRVALIKMCNAWAITLLVHFKDGAVKWVLLPTLARAGLRCFGDLEGVHGTLLVEQRIRSLGF